MLDAAELFPFSTYINAKNEIMPAAAYIEADDDRPESESIIQLLEKAFKQDLGSGKCLIAAIVVDGIVTENGIRHDTLQILFLNRIKLTA